VNKRLTLQTVLDVLSEVPFEKIVEFASVLDNLRLDADRTVWLCGNGGSASNMSHFASDLTALGFKAVCLTDNPAIVTAFTNDYGWNQVYVKQLQGRVKVRDVLVVASVHGGVGKMYGEEWSQNLVEACKYARYFGCKVLALLGGDGGLIKNLADVNIIVPHDHAYIVEGCHAVITHLICAVLRGLGT